MHGCDLQPRGKRASRSALLGVGVLVAIALSMLFGASAQAAVLGPTVTDASLTAVEGEPFTGQVGTFDGLSPLFCSAGSYTATVDWGDGQPQQASISPKAGSSCSFVVTASHTFTEETAGDAPAKYTLQVNGLLPILQSASAEGAAHVGDAPLTPAAAQPITAVEGATTGGTVATFTDGNTGAPASDFRATVDWGDGGAVQGATVSGDSGHFDVVATHVYPFPISGAATITVTDAGGATFTVQPQVTVSPSASAGGGPSSGAAPLTGVGHPPAAGQIPATVDNQSVPVPRVIVSKPRFAGRGAVQLTLKCPAGGADCRGILRLVSLPRVHAKVKRLRQRSELGSAVFLLRAGDSEMVDISLPRSVRRLLSRAASVRAQVLATAFGSAGSVASSSGIAILRRAR